MSRRCASRIALFFLSASALALSSTSARAADEPAAAPATQPEARRDAPKAPRVQPDDDEDHSHVRFGPIVGVGFPRPLALEGFVKIERLIGIGLEYSFLPSMNIAGVDTRFSALAGDLRVFPFRGAFYIGLRGGHQALAASTTVSVAGVGSISQAASAETWFVNPRAGFLWTFKSGLSLGVEAGVQLPINPSFNSSLPNALVPEANATLASVANTLGNGTTPTVDLLRVGFLF